MAKNVEITTAKPIVGKKIFYFIQSVNAELGSPALLPAYRTDGSTSLGGEYLDEQTQQGRLIEKSTDEHTIDLTTYFAPKDPSVKVIEEASTNGDSVKVWEVIVDDSVKTVDETTQEDFSNIFSLCSSSWREFIVHITTKGSRLYYRDPLGEGNIFH